MNNDYSGNYATVSLLNKKMIVFAKRFSQPLSTSLITGKKITWHDMSPQIGVFEKDYETTKKLFNQGVRKRDAEKERIVKFP